MRVAIDTNVLAYAEGLNGAIRQPHALRARAEAKRVVRMRIDWEPMLPINWMPHRGKARE